MMKNKRIIAALIAVVLTISIVGCSEDNSTNPAKSEAVSTNTQHGMLDKYIKSC